MDAGPTFVVVSCTVPDESEARKIGEELLRRRLAACVQCTAVKSRYWWHGEVESAEELRLEVKTTAARVPGLMELIRELHSYEIPEILVTPVIGGDGDYLAWIGAETSESAADAARKADSSARETR